MELIIIVLLLVIAAEVTYLTAGQLRKHRHTRRDQHPMFMDTSVLIDGRIVSLARSGFVTTTVLIPRSVIGELQLLADTGDSDKRARARHGLDVVKELQAIKEIHVEIFNDGVSAPEGVDNRLLTLAKQHQGSLCTIDYNLNKVAQVEGIRVLNVNELTKSLRMAYLPGETMELELTQKGNDSHQAVGHLQDGTMVVVEHASAYVGKTMKIEFIRSLQTAAGKMMFAKLVDAPAPKNNVKNSEKKPAVKGRQPKPQPKRPQQNTAKTTQKRQKRRQTNEDRMVDLANS